MFDEARRRQPRPRRRRSALAGSRLLGQGPVRHRRPADAGRLGRAGARACRQARMPIAVARLRAAGGALIGRTNMTEFAFSGVGVNPHHGTPVQRRPIRRSTHSGRIVVAARRSRSPRGAAFIGLGSDTGGSIRIPAALNGIVGFKSTARLVPADGALPLSTTLDTVCAMTRSVRDAITAHEILAARRVTRRHRAACRPTGWRWSRTCSSTASSRRGARLRAHDADAARRRRAHRRDLACPRWTTLRSINATGGFSARRSLRLAPPAAGAQRRRLRPARGAAHPQGRRP